MTKFSEYIEVNSNNLDKSNAKQTVEDMLHKYGSYSENELWAEFVNQTNEKQKSGELSGEKLDKIADTIKPYLSDEQKEKLNAILKMVK